MRLLRPLQGSQGCRGEAAWLSSLLAELSPYASRVCGTGSYLPERIVDNRALETILDTSDAWIRERTGIGARHFAADDEVTSDLALHAARAALGAAGLSPAELDMIIVATVTPDSPMPACAVRLAHKLDPSLKIPAFDLSAACAGFLFGLAVADQFLRTGTFRRVLVVGVELLSRIVDWTDRTTAVLFGDGAGAVVLERVAADSASRVELVRIHSEGALASALQIPGGGSMEPLDESGLARRRNKVEMRGQEVFRAAIRGITEASLEVLAACGLEPSSVDWFVPHQANLRIIEQVAERLGVGLDRFVLVLEQIGNTSSASIPIALDHGMRSGRVRRGDRVLLAALGAGVSYGAALVTL
ncbi:MAG: beta-ketoacyl-ACP synthase III [Polyangiaceae bacterium]